jgi:hypothetical protein
MTTFLDLSTQISDARFRKAVLLHLVEYLDTNFRAVAGMPPVKVLLTDDKVTVPPQVFEAIVAEVLLAEAQFIEEDISRISSASLVTVVEAPAALPTPVAQTVVSPPVQEAAPPPPPPATPSPPPAPVVVQQPFQITAPPAPPPVLQEPTPAATQQPEPAGRRRRSG